MAPPDLTLDVRSLPAPEPLEHCLEALADLAPGQRLHMLIDREPYLQRPDLVNTGRLLQGRSALRGQQQVSRKQAPF